MQALEQLQIILMIAGAVAFLFIAVMAIGYGHLYLRARRAGVPICFMEIISMRLMNLKPSVIIRNRMVAKKAGIEINARLLDAHSLAGGDVSRLVQACIMANEKGIPWTCDFISALDLENVDVMQCLQDLQGCGKAVTDINPYGRVQFGEKQYDAIAEHGSIASGADVRMTGLDQHHRLLVRTD